MCKCVFQIGHCGVPPLLVQRYSEELRQDIGTMSMVLEQLREKQLRGLGRPCVSTDLYQRSSEVKFFFFYISSHL